jgi:hypothetical protein
MSTGTIRLSLAVAAAGAVMACGGPPPKQAGCPDGTVEKDGSCVPGDDTSASTGGDGTKATDSSGTSDSASSSGGSSAGGSSGSSDSPSTEGDSPSSAGGVPYDQQMVGAKLKRAANAVKKNCGSATESDGQLHGPWGSTKISVVIDNNGHSRDATIPAPYDGTAVGRCATQAFQNFQYPPFKGSDQHVDVDVEIVKPAGTP